MSKSAKTLVNCDQQSAHLHVLNFFELAGVKIVTKFLLVYPGDKHAATG